MVSDFLWPDLLPALALYPEIHYRFRFFPFSRYYLRAPEIIADAPRRLEPRQPLPLLLLIKCAHRFPVRLGRVEVEARVRDRVIRKEIPIGEDVTQLWWHRLEFLELPDESPAVWEVRVVFHVSVSGKNYAVKVDNLPGLSHEPLQVVQSGYPLPRGEGWRFGDLHIHTAYTEDQVEFGAPLEAYYELGLAQGLSFAFAADHSYDLDDPPGSWLESDPQLTRFYQRAGEIERLNGLHQGAFTLLAGFELSAGNSRGRNVHLLLIGQKEFLPGSGDSAERWLRTRPERSVSEVLVQCGEEVLAVAAHPMVKPPLLERLLLGRGCWEDADLNMEEIPPCPPLLRGGNNEDILPNPPSRGGLNRLFGLQVWNGEQTPYFQAGIRRWVEGLLQGQRWKIIAGSDAHGNFNRYRQVGFPMLRLRENDNHTFGQAWTGIKLEKAGGPEEIIRALRDGPSLVSDGPFADLEILREGDGLRIAVKALSNPEFGALNSVTVVQGIPGEDSERVLLKEKLQGIYTWENKIPQQRAEGYVRVETTTQEGHRCLTNPLFI